MYPSCFLAEWYLATLRLVSVPDPKPTPAQIAFSIVFLHVILKAIYVPDEVWG